MKEIDTYFLTIGKTELLSLRNWVRTQNPATDRQAEFLEIVKDAVNSINYNFKIAMIEPHLKNGKIAYGMNEEISFLLAEEWFEKAKAFSNLGKWTSGLATLEELFVYYSLLINAGMADLESLCDDSSVVGNYVDSMSSTGELLKTGENFEFYDYGFGNTKKLVMDGKDFVLVGGDFTDSGADIPITSVSPAPTNVILENAVGVLVVREELILTKEREREFEM